MNFSQLSPLFDYWNSEQQANDEKLRLLKLNPNESASNLFKNEPYKWENLFQCLLRNVISGDSLSIKGLIVLLSTISNKEKDKVLKSLETLLDKHVIYKLRNEKYQDMESSKNFLIALRIIFCIFFNQYGLELKKEPEHIYEKTGMIFYKFRKLILLNK
tara:strand:+ start:82 stop:558 length:477 start_codon:yes stop_codon:yes gene_type:complete